MQYMRCITVSLVSCEIIQDVNLFLEVIELAINYLEYFVYVEVSNFFCRSIVIF